MKLTVTRGRMFILLFILLLISGCKNSKSRNETRLLDGSAPSFKKDFVSLLLKNGGGFDDYEYHPYGKYLDKNGNRYDLHGYYFYGVTGIGTYVSCQLHNIPDMTVLLQLRNCIRSLWISPDNPLTDISFLKNFYELRELAIDSNDIVIDCSIFANLENLKLLRLPPDRIINLEAIYDKSQEEFKLSSLDSITIGEYSMSKRQYGYFLRNVNGLTPDSTRMQYGNSKGENYIDQYGNRFNGIWDDSGGKKEQISVQILYTPDFEVLSNLAYNIISLNIEDTSPITDIAFLEGTFLESLWVETSSIETYEPLKNSFQLRNLELRNPSIEAIESLRYLNHLKYLNISLSVEMDFLRKNGYSNASNFLYSFRDIANLNGLNLLDSELENKERMYLLAQDMFKMSNLTHISFGENSFYRDDGNETDYR